MRDWIRKLLCGWGFHWWEPTTLMGSLVVPVPLDQCTRPDCGIYREFHLHGYSLYTKEAVEKSIELNRRRRAAEKDYNQNMRKIQDTLKDMGL